MHSVVVRGINDHGSTGILCGISNTNVVKINYRAYPDNATNSKIELIYDENAMSGSVIVKEDTLEVVFLKRCGMNLTLKSIDGSNVQTTIYLEAI